MSEGGGYVRKVQEATQKYLEDLLAQGDRMGELVSTFEAEKRRLSEELEKVQAELERQQSEREGLLQSLRTIESEHRRFVERFGAVQRQNDNLANLYVASLRLHGTLDRSEVLSVIQEIVANLIGCEELVIYERVSDDGSLRLTHSVGIAPEDAPNLAGDRGIICRAVRSGQRYIRQGDAPDEALDSEQWLSACVPLLLDSKVTGALAFFRLLPQKAAGYQDLDFELMELLTTHAATALHCSSRLSR